MRYRVVEREGKFYPQFKQFLFWDSVSVLEAMMAGCEDIPAGQDPLHTIVATPSLAEAIDVCRRVEEHNKPKKKPVERVVWRSGMPLPPAKNVIDSGR